MSGMTSNLGQGTHPPAMRWRFLNWPVYARRGAVVLLFVGMTLGLLAPARTLPDMDFEFPYQDKLVHVVIFAALAGAIRWSMPHRAGHPVNLVRLVFVLLAYGFGIECLQPLMPGAGRMFEWADLLADGIGAIAGLWLCGKLLKWPASQTG
jgi:hypothetical protein